jgi:hypothetical protein
LDTGKADADLYADAGARLMEPYRQRIGGRNKTGIPRFEASQTKSFN